MRSTLNFHGLLESEKKKKKKILLGGGISDSGWSAGSQIKPGLL